MHAGITTKYHLIAANFHLVENYVATKISTDKYN